MRKEMFIIGLLFLVASSAATTTTTQPSKTDILKGEWNRTICIALHILQMLSAGIAVILIMIAGLKYMSSEDADDRKDARDLVIRVISILVVVAVGVQIVNYLVAGSDIGSFDLGSCDDLFPTTIPHITTTNPTISSTTTTIGNGTTTTTTSSGSTSSTTSTTQGTCDDPSNPQGTSGPANVCAKVNSGGLCKSDIGDENFSPPPNGIPDLDDILGRGWAQCCCSNGYSSCC